MTDTPDSPLTLLHIGCGRFTRAETTPAFAEGDWQEIRLDIDPEVAPDVVASITEMTPVADASIDAVYSSHNIEHLYPHETALALAEIHRVLKADGYLLLRCPDLAAVCARVQQHGLTEPAYRLADGTPIAPVDILYGWRRAMAAGKLYMAHRSGHTAHSLFDALRAAGFTGVHVQAGPSHYELVAIADKCGRPAQALTALLREHGLALPLPPTPSGWQLLRQLLGSFLRPLRRPGHKS